MSAINWNHVEYIKYETNTVNPKFIAPSKLEIPDKCSPNIAKSTLGPLWLCIPDKGE